MCSAQMVLIIFIGIATIETVTGFSGGGVAMSCDTMLPQHGSPTPESGPFSVPKHFCSSDAGDETIGKDQSTLNVCVCVHVHVNKCVQLGVN